MADNSSIETELKLAFPPAVEGDLAEHPALQPPRASPPKNRRIVSTYFDTPDNALDRNGLSLRIRHADGETIQTIKARGRNAVATERDEWEWRLKGDEPDLSLFPGRTS
jgi:triphosphatase